MRGVSVGTKCGSAWHYRWFISVSYTHLDVYKRQYQGYTIKDEASAFTSTNGEGIATFRINHWGVWLLRTRYDRPAAGELAEKVNEEHYFSSLTFCVP